MQQNSFFLSIAAICGAIIIAGGLIAAAVVYSSGENVTQNSQTQETDVYKSLYKIANKVGIEKNSISSCVNNNKTKSKVENDSKIGSEIGVNGTPSFAIGTVEDNKLDGSLLVGAQPYSKFESQIENVLQQKTQKTQETKKVSFKLSEKDARIGDKDAPVTIVEFSDYGCPFCQRFHEKTYPQIKEKYIDTGKVQYIFKHRPLTRLHPQAKKQAIFAQCVAKKEGDEKFFELTKKIFAN